jgi:hypothetical protein
MFEFTSTRTILTGPARPIYRAPGRFHPAHHRLLPPAHRAGEEPATASGRVQRSRHFDCSCHGGQIKGTRRRYLWFSVDSRRRPHHTRSAGAQRRGISSDLARERRAVSVRPRGGRCIAREAAGRVQDQNTITRRRGDAGEGHSDQREDTRGIVKTWSETRGCNHSHELSLSSRTSEACPSLYVYYLYQEATAARIQHSIGRKAFQRALSESISSAAPRCDWRGTLHTRCVTQAR